MKKKIILNHYNVSIKSFLIFVIVLMARLAFVYSAPEIRVSTDSEEYITLQHSLSNNFSFSRLGYPETYRTPAYPFFLFLLDDYLGVSSYRGIAFVQACLASIQAVLLFWIAKQWFNNSSAWICTILFVLNPGNILSINSILTEVLFTTALVITVWFWVYCENIGIGRFYFILGALIGLLSLIRPITVCLFLPLLIYFCILNWRHTNYIIYLFLFFLGVILTQGTWMARNYYHYRSFYLSETSSANLYVYWAQAVKAEGNNRSFLILNQRAWDEWDAAKVLHPPVEIKRIFEEKAYDIILPHYIDCAQIFMRSAFRLMMDSGLMKLFLAYDSTLPLTWAKIKQSLIHPFSITMFVEGIFVLLLRMLELIFLIGLYSSVLFYTWANILNRQSKEAILSVKVFVLIIFLYLFFLSSGPNANTRLREQYMPLLILMASPFISSCVNKINRICLTR